MGWDDLWQPILNDILGALGWVGLLLGGGYSDDSGEEISNPLTGEYTATRDPATGTIDFTGTAPSDWTSINVTAADLPTLSVYYQDPVITLSDTFPNAGDGVDANPNRDDENPFSATGPQALASNGSVTPNSSSDSDPSVVRLTPPPEVVYFSTDFSPTPRAAPAATAPQPAPSTVSTVTPAVASDYDPAADRGDLPSIFVPPSYPPIDTWPTPGLSAPSTTSLPSTAPSFGNTTSGYSIAPPPAVSPLGAYDALPKGVLWTQFMGAARDAADPNNPWWARSILFGAGSLAAPIAGVEELFRRGVNAVSDFGIRGGEYAGRASLFLDRGEYAEAIEEGLFGFASEATAFVSAASILQPYTSVAPRTPLEVDLPADFLSEEMPTFNPDHPSALGPLDPVTDAVTVQKAVPAQELHFIRASDSVGVPGKTTYVTLPFDTEGLNGIESVYDKLTLGYPGSTFSRSGASIELRLEVPNQSFSIPQGTTGGTGFTEGGAIEFSIQSQPVGTITGFRLHLPGYTGPWQSFNPFLPR